MQNVSNPQDFSANSGALQSAASHAVSTPGALTSVSKEAHNFLSDIEDLITSMTPLTDAYALRGVARYGLNYGPLRLWGSAAFVAGALACGLLVEVIAASHLIWVIASVAALGAVVSFGLQPLDGARTAAAPMSATPCCAGFPTMASSTGMICRAASSTAAVRSCAG